MAWKEVSVKNGKDNIPAFMRGAELELPNKLGKDPQSVMIDGKTYKVLSNVIDTRDDRITLKLELAGARQQEKGSDDKSNERSG